MAQGNINLTINGSSFGKQKVYNNIFENSQEVDNTDGFISVLTVSTTKGANTVSNIKALCIYNEGTVGAEIQLKYQEWTASGGSDVRNSIDLGTGATATRYATMLLPAGEFIYFPNGRLLGYSNAKSAANATSISNVAPDSNEYTVVDSSGANEAIDDSETGIDVDDLAFYKRGDLIRIDDEIMEVTALGAADGAGTLTVIRGTHGSTAAAHDLSLIHI